MLALLVLIAIISVWFFVGRFSYGVMKDYWFGGEPSFTQTFVGVLLSWGWPFLGLVCAVATLIFKKK